MAENPTNVNIHSIGNQPADQIVDQTTGYVNVAVRGGEIGALSLKKQAVTDLTKAFKEAVNDSSKVKEISDTLQKILDASGKATKFSETERRESSKESQEVIKELKQASKSLSILDRQAQKDSLGASTGQDNRKDESGSGSPTSTTATNVTESSGVSDDAKKGATVLGENDQFASVEQAINQLNNDMSRTFTSTFGPNSAFNNTVSSLSDATQVFSNNTPQLSEAMQDFVSQRRRISELQSQQEQDLNQRDQDRVNAGIGNQRLGMMSTGLALGGAGIGALFASMETTTKQFQKMSSMGIAEDLDEFRKSARDAGVSVDMFAEALSESRAARLMSEEAFGDLMKTVTETSKEFNKFGMSQEQLNSMIAKYQENLQGTGLLERLDKERQAQATTDMIKTLKELSAITGKQVEIVEQEMAAAQADANFKAKLSTLNQEQANAMIKANAQITQTFGPDAAQAFRQGIARGGNLMMSDMGAELAALIGPGAADSIQNVMDQAQQGITVSNDVLAQQAKNAFAGADREFLALGGSFESFSGNIMETLSSMSDLRAGEGEAMMDSLQEQRDFVKQSNNAQAELNKALASIADTMAPFVIGFQEFLAGTVNIFGPVGAAVLGLVGIMSSKLIPLLMSDESNELDEPTLRRANAAGTAKALSKFENPGTLRMTLFKIAPTAIRTLRAIESGSMSQIKTAIRKQETTMRTLHNMRERNEDVRTNRLRTAMNRVGARIGAGFKRFAPMLGGIAGMGAGLVADQIGGGAAGAIVGPMATMAIMQGSDMLMEKFSTNVISPMADGSLSFKDRIKTVGKNLMGPISKLAKVFSFLAPVGMALKGALITIGGALAAVSAPVWGLVAAAVAVGAAIYYFRDEIWDFITGAWEKLTGAFSWFSDTISNFSDKFIELPSIIIDKIIEGLGMLGDLVSNLVPDMDILSNPLENASEFFEENIKELPSTIVDGVKNAVGNVGEMISSVIPDIDIPFFAQGGITSGPSIAGEAGPEAVIPLDSSRQIPVAKVEMPVANMQRGQAEGMPQSGTTGDLSKVQGLQSELNSLISLNTETNDVLRRNNNIMVNVENLLRSISNHSEETVRQTMKTVNEQRESSRRIARAVDETA